MKYLGILIVIFSCNSKASRNNEPWREYYYSEDKLKEGFVKKMTTVGDNFKRVTYFEFIQKSGFVYKKQYDENYGLERIDKFEYDDHSLIQIEQTVFFSNDKYSVKINEPLKIYFDEFLSKSISSSVYKTKLNDEIFTSDTTHYMKTGTFLFQKKEYDCLEFSISGKVQIKNAKSAIKNKVFITNGRKIIIPEFGLVKMEFYRNSEKFTTILNEIIPIDEFKK